MSVNMGVDRPGERFEKAREPLLIVQSAYGKIPSVNLAAGL